MSERAALRRDIVALMQDNRATLSDDVFNQFAQRVFNFQYHHNNVYRSYCERRGVMPDSVRSWIEVPAVPTAAFKAAALLTDDARNAQAVFRTSGTTQGAEQRGAHYVLDLELYRNSLLPTFRRFVMPDVPAMPMASLIPPWTPGGDSSLGYMAQTVLDEIGAAGSINVITKDGIDYAALHAWLAEQAEPVCIIGTSLAFVHWFDQLQGRNLSFKLLEGSRIMDTGGFKGSHRAISSQELREQYTALLDIDPRFVVNEYGMTEMLSQFYDAHLREPALLHVKKGPAWVRTAIVDPETLQPITDGIGLLRHFDLANVFSVSAIQTEDLGRRLAGGFEMLGRAAGAAPRGCSIAMDIFLEGMRS